MSVWNRSCAFCVEAQTVSEFVRAAEFGQDAATLDRVAGAAVLPELVWKTCAALAKRRIDVAEVDLVGGDDVRVELAAHRGRAGFDRLAAVRNCGQEVVVDLDRRRRVLGEIAAVGDHDRDRLAHVGDFAVGEAEAPHAVERRAGIGVPHHAPLGQHRGEIVEREHRVDAGHFHRRGILRYAADGSVRMRAAHEGGVQQTGHRDVVDEATAPAQKRLVLDTPDAGADQRCHSNVQFTYFEIASAAFSSTAFGVA